MMAAFSLALLGISLSMSLALSLSGNSILPPVFPTSSASSALSASSELRVAEDAKEATIHSTPLCPVPPPAPILPIPNARQLQWQIREMEMFIHFGINTFTNREWGDGTENPKWFNPPAIFADQWISAAREGGFQVVILTTKHHDGFCLWPSAYTNHSVKSSPWKNGTGDIVRELSDAAKRAGIHFGVYLSPWDRHDSSYADISKYNEHYMAQLKELLSSYGPVVEMWFDGAKGDDRPMEYDTSAWFGIVRQLQPSADIFSSIGPDVRYVGNEQGAGAPATNWSPFNLSASIFDSTLMPSLAEGLPDGPDWAPAECDVSIRPGWFWHATEQPKSLGTLLDIYFHTVGRNCLLLLNVPASTRGRIEPEDVGRLREFRAALDEIFAVDLIKLAASVLGSSDRGANICDEFSAGNVVLEGIESYWAPAVGDGAPTITVAFHIPTPFNVILLQEPISFGQRVKCFEVLAKFNGTWRLVANGTTIGYKRIERVETALVDAVQVRVLKWRGEVPLIARVGLYHSSAPVGKTFCGGGSCESTQRIHALASDRRHFSKSDK